MIYMNAASHGLPDAAVRARMIDHLNREAEIGGGAAEAEAAEEMAAVRDKAARVIGAPAGAVVLVGTTTIGWNAAVTSLPLAGRRALVAPGEWSSDVAVLLRAGATLEVMPTLPGGALDIDALADRLDEDVAVMCAPMVCSLTGERYDLHAVGALARPEGTHFVVDAAQAVGQIPVSVDALNCDVLAATTRKWLRGPRDTAMLYVAPHVFDRMQPNPAPRLAGITGAGLALEDKPGVDRFHAGEPFALQRLGLGVALDLFLSDREAAMAGPAGMASRLREAALEAGWQLATGDQARATVITTIHDDVGRVGRLADALDAAGVKYTTPNPACEPLRPAHSVTGAFLRLSPHSYNTEAEIAQVCEILRTT